MEDLQNESRVVIKREPLVTSRLFEAYLACPTKCYLQFIGEVGGKNDFAVWNESLRESYRREGILKLTTDHSSVLKVAALEMDSWKSVSWHLVLSPIVQAQNIEANLHLVQRIAQKKLDKSSELVPVRFVPENK